MKRYSAEEFSRAGDQFLGKPYAEMDCQEFVERCLRSAGCVLDLKGSNAWFRRVSDEGWTGTPEDCVREFGCVPEGAFLFIHAFDGGEEKRGYHDGKGNAGHIGIKTGRGKGAVHSSSSRGCVAESAFHDRTVPNGGWNMIGLWHRMDYGKTVNWLLEHSTAGQPMPEQERKRMALTVKSPDGGPVNLRKSPGRSAALVERIPCGTEAELLDSAGDWSKIRVAGKTGWMMSQFLCETPPAGGDGKTCGMPQLPDETSPPAGVEKTADKRYSVTVSGLTLEQAREFCRSWKGRICMEVSGE